MCRYRTGVYGVPGAAQLKKMHPAGMLPYEVPQPGMSPGPNSLKLYYSIFFDRDQEEFLMYNFTSGTKRAL